MNLAPVQADVAHLQHPDFLGQQQDLTEQLLNFAQKGLAKVRYRIMVGM